MSIIHANVNLQKKIKHTRFIITKMDDKCHDIENREERLLATSCDYGQTILLTKILVDFLQCL